LAHLPLAVESKRGDAVAQIVPMQDLGLALAATGQYLEAMRCFDEAQRLSREHENWSLLARGMVTSAWFHLDVFDFAGHEALAQEARELARSVDVVRVEVSAGIDLLFNFARRGVPVRAENLIEEVAATTEKATGLHGWLWRLRLAQVRAELALARGEWDETLCLVEIALQHSRDRGRVKYEVLGLRTRGQALAALGRTPEARADLRHSLELARSTGDPALFVNVAAALLAIEADESMAREASATAQRISTSLPNDEMRRIFAAAEPIRRLARWAGFS
jgi:tetratricopeptide (TPR) repeat protein